MPESKVMPVRIAVRIQRRRTRAFIHTSPNGLEIVYVGRPSQWGNPFRVGIDAVRTSHETISVIDDPYFYVVAFEEYARGKILDNPQWLEPLRGKNLSCWCDLQSPCHADVLLRLANK